jgi:outer membrane lipoprotein-sorting protein
MMMRFLLFVLLPFIVHAQVDKERMALDRMKNACEKLKSASFILSTNELIKDGPFEKGEMFVKLQHVPLCMYIRIHSPDAGVEILYRKADWKNELLINPNGFPYVNLKLDMNNLKVRKNAHHSVGDIGFDYLMNMIGHYQTVFGDKLYQYLTITDTVKFERYSCLKMEFDYPEFGYKNYIVKKDEDVVSIAAKNFVNEYMIVSANKNVADIHDVEEGQQIQIPNMFARKIVFYVDLENFLPLVQEIYNEKGLFEKYEYKSFVLNPTFDPQEFTDECKDCGF